jgi:hypothetical protein
LHLNEMFKMRYFVLNRLTRLRSLRTRRWKVVAASLGGWSSGGAVEAPVQHSERDVPSRGGPAAGALRWGAEASSVAATAEALRIAERCGEAPARTALARDRISGQVRSSESFG